MNYDWINTAIENRGVMTLSMVNGRTVATMNWKGEDPVSGGSATTVPDAINQLNAALHEDAAIEMQESGSA
jgi:hypothetical protein